MNRLKELRQKKGLSGYVVAEKIGISTTYLYDLEKEERRLNDDLLICFSQYYDVSIDYILCNDVYLLAKQKNIDPDNLYFNVIKTAIDKEITPAKLIKILEAL
jgi:transcriptional regulator with XRE-family HTH domain